MKISKSPAVFALVLLTILLNTVWLKAQLNCSGGTCVPVTINQGTLTADQQGIAGTATWNSSGVTFTMNKFTVTDTNSASGSKFFEFFNGATSEAKLDKSGSLTLNKDLTMTSGNLSTGSIIPNSNAKISWDSQSVIISPSDGVLALENNAQNDFTRLQLGGTTASFPAIARNGTGINIVLADGSGTTTGLTVGTVTGTSSTMAGYATAVNCSTTACAAASAGATIIAAAATTVTISTTAITANSQVLVSEDASLGTRLGVTCNTQSSLVLGTPRVTTRTAATSFVVSIDVGPTTNPMCLNWWIVN